MEQKSYKIGIDLGGTFIKGGIVDENGNILLSDQVPTEKEQGENKVVENIAFLVEKLLKSLNIDKSLVVGVGMGVPGMIDSASGLVVYSNNLDWENFPIAKLLSEKVSLPVKIANDANVAALGEAKFGCGKDYKTSVLITLGTGVGSGIVLDGKLFEGNRSAGAELGHMVIRADGEKCTCGRKGCFEAYASATALIRETKKAMQENKQSKMWSKYSLDTVDGKTAFDFYDTDISAKKVVDEYVENLGIGLTNIANVFRPEVIMLGGGVCAQGENLTLPLRSHLSSKIFAGSRGPSVDIRIATLGNRAGILGASALL